MIDQKLLNCSSCGSELKGMAVLCDSCAGKSKAKANKLKEVFIIQESPLSFMDYDNFQKMTANFIFVSMKDSENKIEKILVAKDWDLSKNGYIKESSRDQAFIDVNIYLDYENLNVGTIAKVAALLSKSDIDKVAEFIFNQKMLISEKEMVSIFKDENFKS